MPSRSSKSIITGATSVITVAIPGHPESPLIATSDHPNFKAIVAAVNDPEVADAQVATMFDVVGFVASKFEALSERVSVKDGVIYFDGDAAHSALTKTILRALEEGSGVDRLVNFYERVMQNPNEHSREQLWGWIDSHGITVTDEGHCVFYKGVAVDGDSFKSINTGQAVVNGEEKSGAIPQNVGDVVEMPRSSVQHDPSNGCSTGLHAGTYAYANGWARGALLEVHVDPRDVVSVPTDCNHQKVRVCRYTVVGTVDAEYTTVALPDENAFDPEEALWAVGDTGVDWQDDHFTVVAIDGGDVSVTYPSQPHLGTVRFDVDDVHLLGEPDGGTPPSPSFGATEKPSESEQWEMNQDDLLEASLEHRIPVIIGYTSLDGEVTEREAIVLETGPKIITIRQTEDDGIRTLLVSGVDYVEPTA